MSDAGLPPFAQIAAALRVTTERLTREVSTPLDSPPGWNEFEWTVARAVSAMHGISGLLATRLRWHGPPDWDGFLHEQRQQTLACHERIGQVLAQLDRAMRDADVAGVALKGSAVRDYHLHHPGERPMGDIDVLVRPADAPRAVEAILSIGYREAYASRRHLAFAPSGAQPAKTYAEHIDTPLRIELHERIREQLPTDPVDITDTLWPSDPRPGLNPCASFAALLRHVILHTSNNMRAHAMRFLQIYEIAQFGRRMGAADWEELRGSDARATGWWMYPALMLAERYVPGSIPEAQLRAFAAVCPRRLRARFAKHTVHDVSWSNLRIDALPGIEWSRSWSEALRFAFGRAFPSREALRELADGLKSRPDLRRGRWYRSSQAERIARWLVSRPPRVQTLTSVRAAMASASPPLRTDPAHANVPSH